MSRTEGAPTVSYAITEAQPAQRTSTIPADELLARLENPDLTVIDARPIAAYNGWRLQGEARGGHVPGARAFPAAWLAAIDAAEIERLLDEKGAARGRSIVVYGEHDERRPGGDAPSRRRAPPRARARGARPRGRLGGLGSRRREPDRATAQLPAPGPGRLAGRRPRRACPSRRSRRPTSSCSTSTSASPRSTRTATSRAPATSTPTGSSRRRTGTAGRPAELDHALRSLGITVDTTVIVYGRDTEGDANEKWPGRRAGQIAATRAALILRYAGVRDVRLLDGGYDWWVRDGHPVETHAAPRRLGARVRRGHPVAPGADRRPARGQGDPRRPRRRRPRQRPDVEGAHRQGQRLQLHPARRPDPGRRVGQLRHRRVPHAALPERGQHDARVPRDRGQLGRGRDHARQVGRVLLRHRLARERDLVLRRPAGLGPDRGLRRRLARVEQRSRRTTRSTSATRASGWLAA